MAGIKNVAKADATDAANPATTSYRSVSVAGKRAWKHRVVMEEMLGRGLLPGESVHHKNGLRRDNRPENLELWWRGQPAGQRTADLVSYMCEAHLHAVVSKACMGDRDRAAVLITVPHAAGLEVSVDRVLGPGGDWQVDIGLPGVTLSFDEADAEELWRQIGKRLGLDKPPSAAMMQRTRDWEVIQERLDKNKGESFG